MIDKLREIEPDAPVLVLTTGRGSERRARAFKAGAEAVLSTAAPVEKIVATAKRLIGG